MKKNIFPKIKKKIKGFLTDESGKISKKDALWLAVWGVLLSAINEVGAENWSIDVGGGLTCSTSATPNVSHASWIVNWHYSTTPAASVTFSSWHVSHGSHGSHGSSGSGSGGGWC